MKIFAFIVIVLVAFVGCVVVVEHTYDQYEQQKIRVAFEQNFGVKWPHNFDERDAVRPLVVAKMCEAWNAIAENQRQRDEVHARISGQDKNKQTLTPDQVAELVKLEALGGNYTPAYLWDPYEQLIKSASRAGFEREAEVMPRYSKCRWGGGGDFM